MICCFRIVRRDGKLSARALYLLLLVATQKEMKNYASHSKMPWRNTNGISSALLLLCLCLFYVLSGSLVSPAPESDWNVDNISDARTDVIAEESTTVATSAPTIKQPQRHSIVVSCPVDCVCKNSETVDCRGAGIRNVSSFPANQHVTKL